MPATIIRHERPYETLQEFILLEGWSIERKSMVLVDHPDLPAGTPVRCDVVLANGKTLIRAQGKVVEYVPGAGDRAGGLRVTLRRVTRTSQEIVQRILAERAERAEPDARNVQFSLLDLGTGGDHPVAEIVPERSRSEMHEDESGVQRVDAPPGRDSLLQQLRDRWGRIAAEKQRSGGKG